VMLRAAEETLKRGYTHFRVERGTLSTRFGRGGRIDADVSISLLKPPITMDEDTFDANRIVQRAGRS